MKVELRLAGALKVTEYLFGGGPFALTGIMDSDYDVVIKASKWLNQTIPVTVSGSDVDLGTITLVNGDVNGDGSIGNADAGVVIENLE